MAASTSVVGLVTMIHAHHVGGSSTKKRKRFTIQIADPVNGLTVGGNTNKINTADLGLGLTYIDETTSAELFTTATPSVVTTCYRAAPSSDGSYIALAIGSAPADVSIATTQTMQLVIYGY